jgi:glycosyltransferase involved in cell wall biosynthesis
LVRIGVCITTFNRPNGLGSALAGLASMTLPADLSEGLGVYVIDNSADGNARAVVDQTRQSFPWPLHFIHEPRKGVAQARNKALDVTTGRDFIAFIDDDEIPAPDWLCRLVDLQKKFDADVVSGPVLPHFDKPPMRWLVAGRFFEPVRYANGTRMDISYTGNVLFRRSLVIRTGIRFSEALGEIGGEDVDFFDRLRRAGADIRYCNDAIVRETIPPDRATLKWLLRRWFRTGNSEAILYMDRHAGVLARITVIYKGMIRICLGGLALVIIAPAGGLGHWHWLAARLYTIARGFGMVSSAFSIHYHEYAK